MRRSRTILLSFPLVSGNVSLMVSQSRRRRGISTEAGSPRILAGLLRAAQAHLAGSSAPLILSLQLDAQHQDEFDRLREQYFPPALNIVPAHVILFHHLPGQEVSSIQQGIERITADQPPFRVQVSGLRSLGRSVAYTLESSALSSIRAQLANAWEP